MNKLKKYVNWKLTHSDKTAEAEGYPLVLENCKSNKRMKQLEVYGNSVQDGRPTPDAPIEVQSVGERTVNLFDKDTAIKQLAYINMSQSRYYYSTDSSSVAIPCKPNTTYTISHGIQASIFRACYIKSDNLPSPTSFQVLDAYECIQSSGDNVLQVTTGEVCTYLIVQCTSTIYDDFIQTLQVQEGSTATPYEPYGKYKIPVVQRGVNLFSMAKTVLTAKTVNGITFTPLDDERVHIKGNVIDTSIDTTYSPSLGNRTQKLKAGTYRLKQYSSELTQMISVYNNGSFLVNINAIHRGVSVPKDGYLNNIFISITAGNTREWDDIIEIQLVKGTSNPPYEPYVEPTSTNIFLNEPIRKIGDYADYVDFKDKKVIRVIKEQIFTGEEAVSLFAGAYPYYVINIGSVGYVIDDICLCNNFTHQSDFSINRDGINTFRVFNSPSNKSARIGFRLYVDGAIHANETTIRLILREKYESGYPVIFYYGLSVPTEENIDCELPKLNAKTTITEVDTSLLPGNMYGKYIKR